jgi:hypothetical protein
MANHPSRAVARQPVTAAVIAQLDHIGHVLIIDQDTSALTSFEHKFALDILDKKHKYGDDGLRLSDKQTTIVERIHAKIGTRFSF